MTIKFAYYNPLTGENLYAESKTELQDALAALAATVYLQHYCAGDSAYSIVEILENGAEKWYAPTGEGRMTPDELASYMRHVHSFAGAGELPVTLLGGSSEN